MTPGLALLAAFEPNKLAALHATAQLLGQLAGDPSTAADARLAHAVEFATKAVGVEQRIASGKLSELAAAARASGGEPPALPSTWAGWAAWRSAVTAALADRPGARVGLAAFELGLAWGRAERIAYLRASAPGHALLAAEARSRATETAAARAQLSLAITAAGRPDISERFTRLDKWLAAAPRADAIKSTDQTGSAFAEMTSWIQTFEMLVRGLSKAFDAPPPTAGERAQAAALAGLGARDVKLERGVPVEISIDTGDFLAHADQLMALGPIHTVRLRGGLAGRGARLAALPALAGVSSLDLSRQGVTDADLAALARSPHLARLRYLELNQNEITADGIDALAGSKSLPALESVGLQLNRARDPVDALEYYDETHQHRVPTEEGIALERRHGRIRWLHPDD